MDKIRKCNPEGCILEVDLGYQNELHDLHNDDPLAPENTGIKENILSKYCKEIANTYNIFKLLMMMMMMNCFCGMVDR